MKITHALGTSAAAAATVATGLVVGATPAEAATYTVGSGSYGLTCTYDLDTVTQKVSGECTGKTPLGTATATFSGGYANNFSFGTISVRTWFGDVSGNFAGTGWATGTASGVYKLYTPWGALSGSFGATA